MRRNTGKVFVEVSKRDGEIVEKLYVHTSLLQDNRYKDIEMSESLVVGDEYCVKITSNGEYGNAVCCKWGKKRNEGSEFELNGKVVDGELSMQISYVVEEKVLPKQGEKDLVSIIIPCYNSAGYIKGTLGSIAKQTYKNIEVFIVDDGSDDVKETKAIAGRKKEFPVTFIELEENKGAPHARNKGFEKSNGEYVFFLDSDVSLYENCIEELVRGLKESEHSAYSYCSFIWGGKVMRGENFNVASLYSHNYISTMSLIRRQYFVGFDENIKRLQDWDMWITMAKKGYYGVFVEDVLFNAIERKGISSGGSMSWEEASAIVKEKHSI
jgi:hypothetical protein